MKPSTSYFSCRWGLPRSIIKSHPEEKWAWPWTRRAPQIWGFPFNISATAKTSDFKIGTRLEFAKGHYKITHRRKKGVNLE